MSKRTLTLTPEQWAEIRRIRDENPHNPLIGRGNVVTDMELLWIGWSGDSVAALFQREA